MSRSLERLKVTRQVGKRVQLRLLVLCAARRHLSNPTSNEASKVTGKGMFITVVTATFYEAFVIFQGVIGAAMEIKSCSAQGRLEDYDKKGKKMFTGRSMISTSGEALSL
ncbi:hypothetical protein Tco_0397823 [Tanacetum coccineum]